MRFGWTFVSFVEDADRGIVTLKNTEANELEEVHCQYLAGCDGGNSKVRKQLGIALEGTVDVAQMYMVHFRSSARDVLQRWGDAWHCQSLNGTLIAQNDEDIWTLHAPIPAGKTERDMDPRAVVSAFTGVDFDFEVLMANGWAPQLLVAEKYSQGRVFLAGDAAHQYVPTGGYSMNTGMGDAVDLGWKLAATLRGWGGASLLTSYDQERRAIGLRNRGGSERHVGVRFEIAMAMLSEDMANSAAQTAKDARARVGARILELGNAENEALGIEIGYRYDSSSVIFEESGEAPDDDLITYVPTTWPGSRLPSVFLKDGRAVFDILDQGFTLIAFGDANVTAWTVEAERRGLPFSILRLNEAAVRSIYQRDYILVRPDQHVGWRGDQLPDLGTIFDRVTGV